MIDRIDQIERITLPFRVFSYRLSMIIMIGASCALLLLGRAEAFVFDEARNKVQEVTAPVLELFAEPWAAVRGWFGEFDEIIRIYEENERLRQENARLLEWRDAALRMEQEAARYEALLNVQAGPGIGYLTGRVIGDSGGPFAHAFIVNAGAVDGAAKGQAVVDSDGLIGRVVSVGRKASRILLISDINSRVPVLVEKSRYRAVMEGDNTRLPRLSYLPENAVVELGDRIVTSGHGGLLPPGLPVGQVVKGGDGVLRVEPFADEARVDYVRLLEFQFPSDPEMPEVEDDAGDETGKEKPQVGLLNNGSGNE